MTRHPTGSWRWRCTWSLCCGAVAVLLVAGCAPAKVKIEASPDLGAYPVKTIAILPFDALSTPQMIDPFVMGLQEPQGAMRTDIVGAVAIPPAGERLNQPTATVPPFAAERLTRMFYGHLLGLEGLQVLSPEDATRAVTALGLAGARIPPEELARKVAARLSADATLIGRVLVYQERAGSKLGANPAAVGFEVRLIATDGVTLWIGNYYEKQRPMTEDFIGFVQRRGVFVTAEELAEYGVRHVIQQFPFGGAIPRPTERRAP